MDTLCVMENYFCLLPPDMPLRVEVKKDIYFEALNLLNYHTALPRIEFGLKISCALDGYWQKDGVGRTCRVASLENGLALAPISEYLEVYIDLQHKTLSEIHEFYRSITNAEHVIVNSHVFF